MIQAGQGTWAGSPGTPLSPSQRLTNVYIRQIEQCQVPVPTDLCRTAPSTTPCHHTMGLCLVEPRAPAKGPGVAWGTSTAFGARGCGPGPSPGALSSSHLLPCEYQPLSLLPLPLQPLSSPRTDSKSCPRKQNDGHHCPMSGCRHSAVTVTTTPPACPWVTWGCGKVSTPPWEPH